MQDKITEKVGIKRWLNVKEFNQSKKEHRLVTTLTHRDERIRVYVRELKKDAVLINDLITAEINYYQGYEKAFMELRSQDLERIRKCENKMAHDSFGRITYTDDAKPPIFQYCKNAYVIKNKCQACQRDIQRWKELGRAFSEEEMSENEKRTKED